MIDHQNSKQNVSLLLGPKRDDVIIFRCGAYRAHSGRVETVYARFSAGK